MEISKLAHSTEHAIFEAFRHALVEHSTAYENRAEAFGM
jgi:hypothetical protein